MSMTTLLGLSFGVFPCLLFGFIMLISLLVCEYIEEYVAKHLCAWKNRRRRGLRSFYRDFRERRSAHSHNNPEAVQHYSSRSRCFSSSSNVWVGGNNGSGDSGYLAEGNLPLAPSAPPTERPALYGAQHFTHSSNYQLVPVDDSPPSYEECVLPRVRIQNSNIDSHGNGVNNARNPNNGNRTTSRHSKKPSLKKSSSSMEKDKDKDKY